MWISEALFSRACLIKRLTKFTIEVAQDGTEGLQKARTVNPDLIILDIMLPGIDGFKVCQMLKFDERFKEIPIIMLSARQQEEDKKTGLATGANVYITKMGTTDFWTDLGDTIKQLLSESK